MPTIRDLSDSVFDSQGKTKKNRAIRSAKVKKQIEMFLAQLSYQFKTFIPGWAWIC